MQQRPISVMIFGILNIGFGLFDLVVTLISVALLPKMAQSNNFIMTRMHENLWTKITMPLDCIAAVILMAAGIGLLLSRYWARILSIGYGIYAIVTGIVGAIVMMCSGLTVFAMILSLFGSIVTLVYPVLLIIFMRRPNVVAALKPAQPAA